MVLKSKHISLWLFGCLLMTGLFARPQDVQGQCVDFYDLRASYVKCEAGPYSARQTGNGWVTGVIDYGPDQGASRHTVVRGGIDTITTFNNTHFPLQRVPSGEVAAVRLGNWWDGYDACFAADDCPNRNSQTKWTGEAERITYTFQVTDENKYLLMRYAIIWENPTGHNDKLPSFQIETLQGATGETSVDATDLCYNYDMTVGIATIDYVGTSSIYHHICTGSNSNGFQWQDHTVAWCNWRTRVINLEPFLGQTIRLRITSSDCGHKGHFGYSYFTLRCLDANLYSPVCGGPTETRTFTAPEGLNYIWYKVDDNKVRTERVEGETSNTLTVLNDGQMYECYIASPENGQCHISLYAKAEPRLPLASFTIDKHEDCVDTLYLIDESAVSRDGVVPATPHEDVDVVTWDFGDGRSNVTYTPGTPITYAYDGTYTIKQTTRLTNGNCVDDSIQTVTVRGRLTKHEADVYDTICGGNKYTWNSGEYRNTGVYSYVMPNAAGDGHCDSVAKLHLKVWDAYHWNDTIDVLEGKEIPYVWHNNGGTRNLYTSGVYWDSCYSVHGCDSVYKLVMNVRPRHFMHEYDTICRGTSFTYHKNGGYVSYNIKNATDTLIYDSLLTAIYGNDSVYCLHLHVWPTYHYTETRNFCQGDTVDFEGHRFFTDGPHTVVYHSQYGCDSTYTLILNQKNKYLIDTVASISDKQKPFIWHGQNCSGSGTYYDSLTTVSGCDSVIRLKLTIYPTFFQEDAAITLCKDSTIKWHTKYITGSTVGTTVVWDSMTTQYGYDSVYKAVLHVLPSYRVSITEQRAIGETYYFFGKPITEGGVYTYNATTERGCDSIVRLTITFLPTYLIKDTAYICEGSSYPYHKNGVSVSYTGEGVYWDSLKTVAGYDSVYRLQLYTNPVYTIPQSATICQPATYDFFGQTLTTSGVYSKTLTSRSGCDSTIVLTLTVNPAYDIRIDSTICEGESVMFAGESRTTGGNYTQTLTTVGCGCDSIRHLNLTVVPKTRIHHDVHLCTGDYFEWYKTGERITNNRVVSDTLKSLETGCDSINIWHIYAHEAIRDTSYASICQGGSYNFHGHTYTETEVGNDTIMLTGTSVHGCDSSYVLILTVNPKYEQTIDTSLCLGDYVTFNSKNYDRGGIYYDTLKTAGCGCDSAFIIKITEYPRFFTSSTTALCKDSSMVWHKITITDPGTYYDSLKSTLSHGQCDSIYELIVTQQLPKYETVEVTILSTGSYSFNGRLLKESGTYRDTLDATTGACDSIVTLILTVKPVYNIDTTAAICRGEKFIFNGKVLENGGLYTERFISTVYGTDSIVNLTLTVYEPEIHETVVHISDKETYTWYKKSDNTTHVLNMSGTYDDTLQAQITGCDSINRLVLVRHQTYEFNEDGTTCQGTPYYWRGNPYYSTDDYYDSLKTHDWNVDSVYHLHLTVYPTYRHDTTVYICDGDYYDFLGTPINSAGTYLDTIPTKAHSCDSIFRVTVIIRPTRTIPTVASVCQGESYVWRGKTFDIGGEYEDTLRTKDNKCDSIYYHLSLTMKTRYEYNLPPAIICANQWYDFFGVQLNKSGDYDTTFTATNHCDSTYHLHLTVNPTYERDTTFYLCTGDVVTFNGTPYTTGGNYRDTLYTSGCNCDSVYRIHVQEYHPFTRIEYMTICRDSTEEWHGQTINDEGIYYDRHKSNLSNQLCDSVYELHVSIREPERSYPSITILSTTTYFFNGQELNTSGVYRDTLHANSSACDSIVELHLTVLPVYNITYRDTICRGEKYDFNGTELENSGLYTMTLQSAHGTDSVVNLLLVVHEPRINTSIVHICDKDTPYVWTKHDLTTENLYLSGIYDDSLKSEVTKCDSVNRLQLVVHPTYLFDQTDETCQEKTYIWRGKTYSTATVGTFDIYDSLKTNDTWRYDSVYHLTLTVNPIYRHDTTVYICEEGDYYDFNHTHLYHAGTYYDTIKTVDQCDSTFRVKVIVRPTRTESQTRSICPGESYTWRTWHDSVVSVAKEYKDTLKTKDGLCDSVYYNLVLNVKSTYNHNLPDAVICDNQTYDFFGRQLKESGDYDTTFTATNHCDSVLHLHLTVNPTYAKDTAFTLCTGGEVIFNGKPYTTGGTYYQTLKTKNGCNCDSVYTIQINEFQPYFRMETMELCKDSTDTWHGKTIKANVDTTYYDSLTSVRSGNLCDSVYALHVTIRNPEYTVLPVTIQSTSYYFFNGQRLNTEGIYYDTVQAVNNTCDSIIELQLTVLPVYNVKDSHAMCRGESFLFKDTTIETSGLYTRTYRSQYGTDSVVNMQVIVYEPVVVPTVAHISDKETYTWYKQSDNTTHILNATGMYDDTLKSQITGCDSINRLQLFVHRTYLFDQIGETCEGKPFEWRGNHYAAPTVGVFEHYDSLKTNDAWRFDSVYHLTLTVNPIYRHDTTVYICEGEPYDFNGVNIYTGGTYYDTLLTEYNCDSMFIARVHVRPTRISPETRYICPGDSYDWHGKTYTAGGEYEDTLKTKDDLCDSIYYHLTLRIKTRYERDIDDKICSNELPYDFHGRLIYQAGNYDTTFQAITTMCDSVLHLHLTVNQAYDTIWYDTICEGQSVLFDNISRSESGIYVYRGTTKAGCDSVVTLYLTVIAKQNAYIEKHICEGDYIEIAGERVTQSGTYTEHSISSFGCDSTTTWRVSTHTPMRDTTYKAICKGTEFKFHDVIYRDTGTYVQENRSRYNCDSTYVLVLTHNPVYQRDTSLILCEHDYFMYNSHFYTEGGNYSDTARTKGGCNCDSILNISITKYPVSVREESKAICRGESYTWRGRTLTRQSIYYDTVPMQSAPCDSIVYILRLKVNEDFYDEQVATICADTYFSFRRRTYNETGVYYDSLSSAETGCDSVYCLKLTVNPTYRNVESVNRCDIEPYWYNGRWLRETGDYEHALKTTCGCDSTSILHLIVTPTKHDTVRVNLCEGETYYYYGKPITQSGLYQDTINQPDIHQCIVSVMDIGFRKPTAISNVLVDEICADDETFRMKTYYTGTKPEAYSLVFDDKARAAGFVNILNEPFDDVIYAAIPRKEAGDYVRPDYYSARLTMDNNICANAGTVSYDVQLLVKYPSWIIEQNWNDVVAVLNEYYNGGYVFSDYEWYINGSSSTASGPYIYMPQTLAIGDEVAVALTRKGEDYSVPSCPIVIYDKSPELVSEFPILCGATDMPGRFFIQAKAQGTYTLYSPLGHLIKAGSYRDGDYMLIDTHTAAGCYLLRLTTEEYGTRAVKLILR